MGERLLGKYRGLYRRAMEVLSEWEGTQTLTEALLSSATNVIARLPALEEEEHFRWALEDLPHVVRAVRAKQMLALEATLQRLRDTVGSFEQYSEALERLVREGKQLQQQATPAPTAFGSVRRGATPSLAECQEGLENVWRMHHHEALLKKALVGAVQWEATQAELGQIHMIVSQEPNLELERSRGIYQLLVSLKET